MKLKAAARSRTLWKGIIVLLSLAVLIGTGIAYLYMY